jgi:hypothetical protein
VKVPIYSYALKDDGVLAIVGWRFISTTNAINGQTTAWAVRLAAGGGSLKPQYTAYYGGSGGGGGS